MKIKNKIGYCQNRNLRIKNNADGGHYVYIRKINKNGTCDVNTITSLENKSGRFDIKKLSHIRKGNTYSIPIYDANFSRWSGVTKTPIKNVRVDKIKNIGCKKIKKRHYFYIGKYCDK